ncbi:restriction endonuclease subunit S [Ligilactobacillus aviarius]|uniref:restriction endonuclease subunit S n=1 Tax=Ligilactobacillus aviarius TaxID=1606 RepID=UPI0022A6D539|nr:restriction endonuclease subunit S [Ligilactobacillus aviarius]
MWEQRELGQLMEIGSVKRIHMNEWKNTGVPFFRARDIVAKFNNKKISDPIYISEETYNSNILKSGKVKKGQLLITGVGTIGIPYLITDDSPLYFKDGNVIWLKNNNYDGNFIFYFFTTNLFKNYLFKITGTGTVGTYTIENAKKTPISTPQINEQIKIGKLFNILENLLALYERKLKLLSQVKKYFLDNLFAEKEYPNLRFKGFTDAWEKIKLKDTQTTLTDGNYANLYPKPADMTDADKGIPFLTGGNLKNGILDLENAKYITKEKHSQLKSGHLEEDDIVIAVRGSLGELGYVTKQNIDWNINSQLAIIRTSKNELIGKFLLYFFLSSKGKSKLLSRQTGTALKQLPLQQLKTIVVPKTLLLEQQKISNILKTIDKTISFYKGKQQHFAEIKNTLLNTMFI